MRHFLNLLGLSRSDLLGLFERAKLLKREREQGVFRPLLQGRVLGLIFEKPSLRTRVSFETAMAHFGGSSIFLTDKEVGLGTRESTDDAARTMSQYVDGIVLRTFEHKTLEEFAAHASVPVINGLSNYNHPCQALADLFTIHEVFGSVEGRTLAFVGDGNNVARSVALCAVKLGMKFVLASPSEHGFDEAYLELVHGEVPDASLRLVRDAREAVHEADVIYTDVWTSMGQENERQARRQRFAPFQVNEHLLAQAPSHARIMHCLPAHRGEEITGDAADGPQSIIFQQAGNRLHAQKALLLWLLTEGGATTESKSRNSRQSGKKTARKT